MDSINFLLNEEYNKMIAVSEPFTEHQTKKVHEIMKLIDGESLNDAERILKAAKLRAFMEAKIIIEKAF